MMKTLVAMSGLGSSSGHAWPTISSALPRPYTGGYIDDINAGRDGLLNGRYALFIGGRSPHHPYSTPAKGDGRNLKAGFPKRSLLHSNTSSRLDLFAAYSNNSLDY